jgi:hypothetical protein
MGLLCRSHLLELEALQAALVGTVVVLRAVIKPEQARPHLKTTRVACVVVVRSSRRTPIVHHLKLLRRQSASCRSMCR